MVGTKESEVRLEEGVNKQEQWLKLITAKSAAMQ
jgi:hypothetical protein